MLSGTAVVEVSKCPTESGSVLGRRILLCWGRSPPWPHRTGRLSGHSGEDAELSLADLGGGTCGYSRPAVAACTPRLPAEYTLLALRLTDWEAHHLVLIEKSWLSLELK